MYSRSLLTSSVLAGSLFISSPAVGQSHPSIFAGAPVKTATLPNGAIINEGYVRNSTREGAGRIVDVRDRVWVLQNYSIVNCVVVETAKGLVVFDTGTNRADGLRFLELIRSRTTKPIIALVYSHNHYTGGAAALLAGAGQPDVMVIGHPDLEANFKDKSLNLRPSVSRRANMQFGHYLPASGPDGRVSPPSTKLKSPADGVPQHVPVNRTVADDERLDIGGTEFVFYHAEGDTDDTLTVWIPSLSTAVTNVISQQFFAMSTLRGQPFRDPIGIISSYTRIRDLAPEHYVPSHGGPVSGKAAVNRRMQLHRDAYAFTYNQAIRGINLGWSPDGIVERVPLPAKFRNEPSLYEGYSEYEFALRGIYSGLIGWFAEDTSALHPPTPGRVGQAIVQGFGGTERLLAAASAAQQRKEYNLAAVLAGYAVSADPEDQRARATKAQALRSMGRISTGMQSHNFYLTEALELEGKTNTRAAPKDAFGGFGYSTVANLPPAALVTVLESRIIPAASEGVNTAFVVDFKDANQRFRVDIRSGVAEVVPADREDKLPVLSLTRPDWFAVMTKKATLPAIARAGKATVTGVSAERMGELLSIFDPF